MLEILIHVATGDIVAAKITPARWGRAERPPLFRIERLDDAATERRCKTAVATGATALAWPFAAEADVPIPPEELEALRSAFPSPAEIPTTRRQIVERSARIAPPPGAADRILEVQDLPPKAAAHADA